MATFCTNCGNQAQEGWRFCSSCEQSSKDYDTARYLYAGGRFKMASGIPELVHYRSLPTELTGIALAADVLSYSVFVMAPYLETNWKKMAGNMADKTKLPEALAYKGAIEYLWFLLRCLGMEIASIRRTHSKTPSVEVLEILDIDSESIFQLPSELISAVIREVNEVEMEHHVAWFNNSLTFYGNDPLLKSENGTELNTYVATKGSDNNVLGTAAYIIAHRLEEPDNIRLRVALATEAAHLYNDLKIPKLAKDLENLIS